MSNQLYREKLFSIYNYFAIVEVKRLFGNGMIPMVFLGLAKSNEKIVKIACFDGKAIEKQTKCPEEVDSFYEKLRGTKIKVYTEADIEILKMIPEPVYTDEFISFIKSVQKWIEKDTDEIEENYFHREISSDQINYDRLCPFYYTDEAISYFKYIQKESFLPLSDVTDVLKPLYNERESEDYSVKTIGFSQFEYPIKYESLQVRHPKRKARYLKKGDIIVSTIHPDGKLKVYLINEEPKENISTSPHNLIIRANKVSPEYLFLYLQSETADKYVFYNNPCLQISVGIVKAIPVAMPSDKMECMAALTLQVAHPAGGIVPLDEINETLRNDTKIDITDRPFQSLMIQELIGNMKMEKRGLIEELIRSDTDEVTKCLDAGAYKSCLILCGSILETVLLDWLSEIENTNYFVDDENMQINLYGLIRRLKDRYNPDWNNEARKAHDVRLKRNLVHPVKCVVEHPDVNRETCLNVIEELQEILVSRGIESNIGMSY